MLPTAPIAEPPVSFERYHTFWRRLFAFYADYTIITIISYIFYSAFRVDFPSTSNYSTWVAAVFILKQALIYLYFIWMTGKYGQTVGKMAAGIKVIDAETEQHVIGFRYALYRELPLMLISGIMLVFVFSAPNILTWYTMRTLLWVITIVWILAELITMFTNDRRRAIHDMLARSVTIKVRTQK